MQGPGVFRLLQTGGGSAGLVGAGFGQGSGEQQLAARNYGMGTGGCLTLDDGFLWSGWVNLSEQVRGLHQSREN